MLRRYSNIEYILNMDFKHGFEFAEKAFEKEVEEKAFEKWLVDYRLMTSDTFISFEDYLKITLNKENNVIKEDLTKEQIEEKVKSIIDLTL